MESLISGYEYDIFISYRQKDNKGDRWVSAFVEALKTELESTFKEEISVYFDINPHDGLLETHDVNASLKEKLKCLIFIPIISRTYCDPKSFAWEHEFKAFVEQASKDQFGLKVKLPGGNVANRVLPVRIHDLDASDIKEFELILEGVLRGIEFIYKETGVNRSLTPKDDERKNLNGTIYRNQINKVALAIKEIILGMQAEPASFPKEKEKHWESSKEISNEGEKEDQDKHTRINKVRLSSGAAILALLIIVAILIFLKLFHKTTFEKPGSSGERISIAVMPFQNLTIDTIWNTWQDGIQDMLITYLSTSPDELLVRQPESIKKLIQGEEGSVYSSITPSVARKIARKLDAQVYISGSLKQAGSKIRLSAQLIDSGTDEIFKSFELEAPSREESIFQIVDSLKIIVSNFLIILKLENEVSPDIVEVVSTNSPEAYKYFICGQNAVNINDYPTAVNCLSRAIEIDSNFTFATILLSVALYNNAEIAEAKTNCLKIYGKRDKMPLTHQIYTNWIHSFLFETPDEEIKYLRQLLQINDQSLFGYYNIGLAYNKLYQYKMAIPYFERVFAITKKWRLRPLIKDYFVLGETYHNTGQYGEERKTYKKAEQYYSPERFNRRYAILSLAEGDTVRANQYFEKLLSLYKNNLFSESDIVSSNASIYSDAGILNKAESLYRKAYLLAPEDNGKLFNYAMFLINNDRNLIEGMDLINKVLQFYPENYYYLDIKGWGLYMQGKYREALEILQRSWDLRREKAVYNHTAFLHLEAAKKAVAGQK